VIKTYAHLTQDEAPSSRAVAILPLAAIEAHGPHLPLGTDAIIADGILDRASQRDTSKREALRLPTIWLGASDEHGDRAGTLSRQPEAVMSDICSVGVGLAARGVNRVILFNAHGGNIALATMAALKLRTRHNMLAANVHWLDFGLPATLSPPAPAKGDVHGGWMETSILLHLAPELVKAPPPSVPGRAPAPSLFPHGPIQWGWLTSDLAPAGYIGRPDVATADFGRTLVDHAADRLNALIEELSDAAWPRP